ncbi:hypothetical protein PCC7424_0655 [Gloeothece citriformis PCC 7424]|uniref:Uncharacterized protein n=1 Tax=Gloeothece citriformis (strain PCC 7424) TaxID=65393 RepID=B7KET9_GLOC7|nr:hypothetical protein PCC7424_0655 [Gloeothece citriformis PCC 7424]
MRRGRILQFEQFTVALKFTELVLKTIIKKKASESTIKKFG